MCVGHFRRVSVSSRDENPYKYWDSPNDGFQLPDQSPSFRSSQVTRNLRSMGPSVTPDVLGTNDRDGVGVEPSRSVPPSSPPQNSSVALVENTAQGICDRALLYLYLSGREPEPSSGPGFGGHRGSWVGTNNEREVGNTSDLGSYTKKEPTRLVLTGCSEPGPQWRRSFGRGSGRVTG